MGGFRLSEVIGGRRGMDGVVYGYIRYGLGDFV
jgi:hypothetical protein